VALQFVHHPIWDYDVPCAPILANITVNGKAIKAVAQPTKQGFLYVFDRVTGQPVWPIEERPVEQGKVPTEWYAPTQPFPTKPPPFERQGFLESDVIDFTPAIKAEAMKIVSEYKIGPVFTPPIVRGDNGKIGTLYVPNGANWPGGSLDPETNILYLYSHSLTRVLSMVNDPKRSDMNYINGGGENALTGAGPAAGEAAMGPDHRDRPEQGRDRVAGRPRRDARQRQESSDAEGRRDPRTGRTGGAGGSSGGIGTLTTKTLVISGEGGRIHRAERTRRCMLRAVRQGDRQGSRRRLHARRADRRPDT
jgi:quinoprotein glucose dehydrogenase